MFPVPNLCSIERKLSRLRCSDEERQRLMASRPPFGELFTDHMVVAEYTKAEGWHDFVVTALGPFSCHPATSVFHYGQAIFEGLKTYSQPDGSLAAFRVEKNAERFIASAQRMAMPPLPKEMFLASIQALVETDRKWVPAGFGESLYLRPFMIARESLLGTRPSSVYTFSVIACPVGNYFPNGLSPVSVWVSTDYVRAVRGGTGEAKCAGNYAASFLAQQQAREQGCDQVVWLDAIELKAIEEMGGMNLYFVFNENGKKKVVTPAPSGALLKGVTRDTLLTLAGDCGYLVEERRIELDEWQDGCANGRISEVFACGTAAVITPVGRVKSARGEFSINDGKSGEVTMLLREKLLRIQHGLDADPYGWRVPLVGAND